MKKGNISNLLLILMFLVGLSLLLYPTIADRWNAQFQSKAILNYAQQMVNLNSDEYQTILSDAQQYNTALLSRENPYASLDDIYNASLNVDGDGLMAYLEIPAINVLLPIYHGTEEQTLNRYIGHIDWSSLPVGGESTHCVVSGHRGLPSSRLFTDLDKLVVGDTFMMNVLDEVLTYEVDQIRVVEPHQTEDLLIEEGKDLVTLVTCTPYGVNSHRLLVRGHRVANAQEVKQIRVTADAVQIEPILMAPLVAAPILLVLLISLLLPNPKPKKRRKEL